MRAEREMFQLILDTARADERVRAVLLNGSRANPDAPRDVFQDYDVVFIVTDVAPFAADPAYIRKFGEPLIVQMPETMRDPMGDGRFIWLALFEDGVRVDLQIQPLDRWREMHAGDSETIPLLDKDDLLPAFPPASDRDYHIRPPEALAYFSCCNDFWWCLQNVAKGIRRDELPYAMDMFNRYIRDNLNEMVCWAIGVRHGFNRSAGKAGKYFRRYLTAAEYARYCATYADADYAHLWQAIEEACGLFRDLACEVGAHFGYPYLEKDDAQMTAYLRRVREDASWPAPEQPL